jgi:hypothetical protein
MAQNVSKKPTQSQTDSVFPQGGVLGLLDRIFNMNKVFGGEFPVEQAKYFLWIAFLVFVYISFSVNADRLVQRTDKLKEEVEELRAAYTAKESEFMKAGKLSEIIKQADSLKIGIEENKIPPNKIISEAP